MKTKRTAISKRTRFEVFKRDAFKCQYCGQSAPDILLEIDHIVPVSRGGDNNILNLLTSCEDCNSGKSNIPLERKEEIRKQKAEMDKLQERRNQINMMAKWRINLADAHNDNVNNLAAIWMRLCNGSFSVSEAGKSDLRKLLSSFSFQEIAEAMQKSVYRYAPSLDEPGVQLAFSKIGGCARMSQIAKTNPEIIEFYKIRSMLRKTCRWVDFKVIQFLEEAFRSGVDVEYLSSVARRSENYTSFQNTVRKAMEGSKSNA